MPDIFQVSNNLALIWLRPVIITDVPILGQCWYSAYMLMLVKIADVPVLSRCWLKSLFLTHSEYGKAFPDSWGSGNLKSSAHCAGPGNGTTQHTVVPLCEWWWFDVVVKYTTCKRLLVEY